MNPAFGARVGCCQPQLSVSVLVRGTRHFSDVDVERARLLHQYALDRASADAQRLADRTDRRSNHLIQDRLVSALGGQTGKHLLGLSFTGFDQNRLFGQCRVASFKATTV